MTELARSIANLEDTPTEILREELARALEITAENLVWLARLWNELEMRGEDLRQLRGGLRNFLPLIASGKLDAQAAVQFAGNLTMLRALSGLPLEDQRRIVGGQKLTLVEYRGDEVVTRSISPDDMTSKMIRQVFTTGRVRSEEEQRLIVTTLQPARKENREARKKERIAIGMDRLAIWRRIADRHGLTLEDLLHKAMQPIIEDELRRERGH